MKINYWAKLEPGVCYHIYNRAVGNEKLFLSSDHYAYFLDKWQTYITPYFSTYAYCLMPNHFHFLAKAKPLNEGVLVAIRNNPSRKADQFLKEETDSNTFYASQFKAMFRRIQ